MKALVYQGHKNVAMRELAEPVAGDGEVIVRVGSVGICGSDIGVVMSPEPPIPPPFVLGHEFCGWREDTGEFVVGNPIIGCGVCLACQDGNTHCCAQRTLIGFRRQGAYAQRVAVPESNLLRATGLERLKATLVEPIANGLHAWNRAGKPQGRLAVMGAGAVGLSILHVLKTCADAHVTVVDPVASRLVHATGLGADAVASSLTGSYDAVFDAAGTAQTRQQALACTRLGGTVALIGLHDDVLDLSALQVIAGDKTICGCFAYTVGEFAQAVFLAATISTDWVRSVPFDEAESVYAAILNGQGSPVHSKTCFHISD